MKRPRARRVLVLLIALVVGLGILAFVFLHPARLTPRVEALLDDTLRGQVRIERVAWVPPWSVEARGFVMSSTTGLEVLRVAEIRANVDPAPLLAGQLHIHDVRVRGARARVQRGTGNFGLVEAFLPRDVSPPSDTPSSFALTIADARVEDADVTFAQPGLALEVRGATIARALLTFDATGLELRADAALPQAALAVPGLPALTGGVDARGARVSWSRSSGAARVAVDGAEVTLAGAPHARLSVSGELAPLATDAPIGVTAQLGAHARLDELSAFVDAVPLLDAVGSATVSAEVRGALFEPTITATVSARGLRFAQRSIRTLHAVGGLRAGRLEAAPFAIELGDGGTISGRVAYALETRDLEASVRLEDVAARAELESPYVPQRISGAVDVTGGLSMLTVDGRVAGGGASLALSGTAGCAGCTIGDAATALDLGIDLRHGALTPFVAPYAPGTRIGGASLVARARGTLAAPRVAGELRVRGVRHPAVPTAEATLTFRLDGARLVVVDAAVTSSVGRAQATGEVLLPLFEHADRPLRLGLDVSTSSVSLRWLSRGYATGRLRAEARVDGAPSAPSVRLKAELDGVTLKGGIELAPLILEARADEGRYTLSRVRLERIGGGGATVEGSTDGTTVTARVIADALPLDALAVNGSVVGTVDAAIAVEGPLAHPHLDAELEAVSISVAGTPFSRWVLAAHGPLDALAVETRLVGLGGTVRVEGSIDVTRQVLGDTQLLLRHLALPDLPMFAGVGARVDAELNLSGPLPYPVARGRLTVRDVTLAARPLGLDPLVLVVEPKVAGVYALDGTLGSQLAATALLTLEPALGVAGFAEARALSLRPVLEALIARQTIDDEGAVTEATGVLGGHAELSYDARGFRASGELRQLDLSSGALRLELAAPARIDYAQDELRLERVRLEGLRGSLEVEGTAAETLDLRARANVNAAVLSLASRQIQEATGRFSVDASLRGDRDAPQLSLDLEVNEPVVVRPRLGVREVVLTSGRIHADRERVTVEGIDGEIAGGTFHVGGFVSLPGGRLRDVDLSLDGSSLPLRTRDLGVEANLNLRLSGTADAPRLSGRLEIVRARYQKQFRLENFAFVAARSDDEPSLAQRIPWLADLDLDLRAQSAGDIDLNVDATGVKVTLGLGADVLVTGTPVNPRLGGRIRAESGRLRFPRADLEVTTADIDLDPFPAGDSSGISVRLVAEGEVPTSDRNRTYLVRLVLEGPLEQMSLDLQSAGLDRLAVLSLLITGRIGLDREGALAFAGSQLAAPLAGFLENELEKALNLGIKLDAEVSTGGVRVTASREITRRLVVESTFQRAFDNAGTFTTQVRAILFLFDRAFLEARASQTTQAISTPGELVDDEGVSTSVELKYQLLGR